MEQSVSSSIEIHKRAMLPSGCIIMTDAMKEKAKVELKESEENIKNGLRKLKELIRKERLECRDDDAFLIRFLRVKKYKVPKSFDAIKKYSQMTSISVRHCGHPDPEALRIVLKHKLCGVLPQKDSEGRAVGVFQLGLWNPDICPPGQVYNTVLALLCLLFEDPALQINGVCGIFDIRVVPYIYVPLFVKYCSVFLTILGGFPVRVRRFDIISDNPIVKIVYRLLKHLIPRKIKERIVFHSSDMTTLWNYYDRSILPEEYGGDAGPFSNDYIMHRMDEAAQKMLESM